MQPGFPPADGEHMSEWNVIAGHFLTRDEVAHLTGMGPRQVSTDASLLRIASRVSNVETYPAFQFDQEGKPACGLEEILVRLGASMGAFEIAALLSMPAAGLGGRSPISWLREGGSVERVIRLVA